jgi:Trk-type K+ transport system membrane component
VTSKRPISITILASVYLIVGAVGFVVHFREILARHAFQFDDALIELTEVVALVCGVFLLRGRNWARWLALAWIAFHVTISFFDSLQKVAVHGLFLVVIAYFLFRSDARTYFQHREEVAV